MTDTNIFVDGRRATTGGEDTSRFVNAFSGTGSDPITVEVGGLGLELFEGKDYTFGLSGEDSSRVLIPEETPDGTKSQPFFNTEIPINPSKEFDAYSTLLNNDDTSSPDGIRLINAIYTPRGLFVAVNRFNEGYVVARIDPAKGDIINVYGRDSADYSLSFGQDPNDNMLRYRDGVLITHYLGDPAVSVDVETEELLYTTSTSGLSLTLGDDGIILTGDTVSKHDIQTGELIWETGGDDYTHTVVNPDTERMYSITNQRNSEARLDEFTLEEDPPLTITTGERFDRETASRYLNKINKSGDYIIVKSYSSDILYAAIETETMSVIADMAETTRGFILDEKDPFFYGPVQNAFDDFVLQKRNLNGFTIEAERGDIITSDVAHFDENTLVTVSDGDVLFLSKEDLSTVRTVEGGARGNINRSGFRDFGWARNGYYSRGNERMAFYYTPGSFERFNQT